VLHRRWQRKLNDITKNPFIGKRGLSSVRMEAVEKAVSDLANNVWKIDGKVTKIFMITFAYRSSCYFFYAPYGTALSRVR